MKHRQTDPNALPLLRYSRVGVGLLAMLLAVTMFFYPIFWEGLKRLAIAAACVGGIILVIRSGRDKDDEGPAPDDFRP